MFLLFRNRMFNLNFVHHIGCQVSDELKGKITNDSRTEICRITLTYGESHMLEECYENYETIGDMEERYEEIKSILLYRGKGII